MFDRQGCRKYLNETERWAFFKATKREKDPSKRAFCLLLLYTGCRISEALNLTPANIDLSHKTIVFETLKRRKRGIFRAVPVPDSFVGLMGEIIMGKGASAKIWKMSRPTAYRLITGCMKKAGIAGAMSCPKGLRHGFAVACIAENIPLPTIQKWMGHARLETTAIYLGVSGNEERKLAQRLWKGFS